MTRKPGEARKPGEEWRPGDPETKIPSHDHIIASPIPRPSDESVSKEEETLS